MSIQAVAWVLDHSRSRGVDRLVLISLANHANTEDLAWPSQRRIAREAGIGLGTVNASLVRLTALGEIVQTKVGSTRTSGQYRLTFTSVQLPNADQESSVQHPNAAFDDGTLERSPGERSVRPGVNAAFGPGPNRTIKNHHELEISRSAEKNGSQDPDAPPPWIALGISRDAWVAQGRDRELEPVTR